MYINIDISNVKVTIEIIYCITISNEIVSTNALFSEHIIITLIALGAASINKKRNNITSSVMYP